jgi:murein DD-endopeptidase MepM/ murein hydrolase activator NlpD
MLFKLVRGHILLAMIVLASACSLPQAGPAATPAAPLAVSATDTPLATPAAPTPAASPTSASSEAATPTVAPSAAVAPTSLATPLASAALAAPTAVPPAAVAFSYPIGMPGQPLGDGFFIRHGYATENTWYNPGYWHTGEDWYAVEGDTAGAHIYAVADGQVVYAGANYPGRVVIVRHAGDLFSMYGHLDPGLNIGVDQQLARGDLIGTVLRRNDATPNHLHFEIRTFDTTAEVNGRAPRYPFRCGPSCPPGPGYWPIDAPDHPGALGWRNPVHVLARRVAGTSAFGQAVVATRPVSPSLTLWSSPPDDPARTALGQLDLHAGERFALLDLYAGAEDTRETSANAYQLWYRIALPDGRSGWVQAAVPSTFETGGDGRPSSVYFNFIPYTFG